MRAEDQQVGQPVRCPTCLATVKVPETAAQPASVGAVENSSGGAPPRNLKRTFVAPPGPRIGGASGKRYGFNCVYCSSRLEANDGMAGQEGQCPTCGSNITIPILDRYGRLIDPVTRQVIKQDPHPVHAYAAAGERAPDIIRDEAGLQKIRCPRCATHSPIVANNCRSCGMPFTMEGTTIEASGASNGFCVASLVLGILGIPAACAVIPAVLAVVFGTLGYMQVGRSGSQGGKGMAIAGMGCGAIGCVLAVMYYV